MISYTEIMILLENKRIKDDVLENQVFIHTIFLEHSLPC